MLLLCAETAFKPGAPFFGEFTSENLPQGFIPGRPSLAYEGRGDSVFRAELPVGVIGIYGIGCHASYPHVHELLLHADAVLQAYPLVESLEREVFDEPVSYTHSEPTRRYAISYAVFCLKKNRSEVMIICVAKLF